MEISDAKRLRERELERENGSRKRLLADSDPSPVARAQNIPGSALSLDLPYIVVTLRKCESTRVYRRLWILRGLEHEQSEALFPGG